MTRNWAMEYHLEKYGEHVEEWNVVLPTKNQVKITVETLLDNGACSGQVELFNIKFPKGIVLRSEEHAVRIAKSVANVFDFTWAGGNLLEGRFEDLYMEAKSAHRKAYIEAIAPHWKAYKEAIAQEWKDYKEAKTHQRLVYKEATEQHWQAYMEEIATEFAKLYWKQGAGE